MDKLLRYLSRNPLVVAGAVLIGLVLAVSAVTYYVEHSVRPRREAALLEEIRGRIAAADEQVRRERWEAALSELRFLLARHADRLGVHERGRLLHQIGLCYAKLGEQKGDKETLNKALEAYQQALALRTRERDPAGFGETERALGALHLVLAGHGTRPVALGDAIGAYRAALEVYAPGSQPEDYALTQRALGNAYRELFRADPRSEHGEAAARAYGEALRVFTREAHPREFARTEVELGLAYLDFGKAHYTGVNTRKAIQALEGALAIYKGLEDQRATQDTYRHLASAYTQIAAVTSEPGIRMKFQLDARRATYLADGASISDKAAIDANSGRIRTTD